MALVVFDLLERLKIFSWFIQKLKEVKDTSNHQNDIGIPPPSDSSRPKASKRKSYPTVVLHSMSEVLEIS